MTGGYEVLGRLVVRNLFRGGARSVLGTFAVAVSLVVNAVFATYASDVTSQAKYSPGQPRLVLVSTGDGSSLSPDAVTAMGSVLAAEQVRMIKGFVCTTPFDIWLVVPDTRLAVPRLAAGQQAGQAGLVVPKELAVAMDLSVGSDLPIFLPQTTDAEDLKCTITGVSDDPLWPFIIATADGALGKVMSGSTAVLAELAPGTSVAEWSRRIHGRLRAHVQCLESLTSEAAEPTAAEVLKARLASIILLVAALGVTNHVMLSMIERRH